MHAGGVLIAPGELTDFCPLYKAPGTDGEEGVISMFDKDDIEQLGLVSLTSWIEEFNDFGYGSKGD